MMAGTTGLAVLCVDEGIQVSAARMVGLLALNGDDTQTEALGFKERLMPLGSPSVASCSLQLMGPLGPAVKGIIRAGMLVKYNLIPIQEKRLAAALDSCCSLILSCNALVVVLNLVLSV